MRRHASLWGWLMFPSPASRRADPPDLELANPERRAPVTLRSSSLWRVYCRTPAALNFITNTVGANLPAPQASQYAASELEECPALQVVQLALA